MKEREGMFSNVLIVSICGVSSMYFWIKSFLLPTNQNKFYQSFA